LLTWEEYYNQHRLEPYILEIKISKGGLLYYGSYHTANLRSPIIEDIEGKIKKFKPTLILSEGGIWPLIKSRRDAVRNYGEQGLLRYLAYQEGIPIKSIEPRKTQEIMHLLKFISQEKIKIFYVLRQSAINQMLKRDHHILDDAKIIFNNLIKLKPFQRYPYTFNDLEERINRLFPELESWQRIPAHWFCSGKFKTWLNKTSRIVNDFRNQHMLKTIIKELKKGKKVFAVVGRSHVVMQEPVLRSLMIDY
jgi:hypothetical protein